MLYKKLKKEIVKIKDASVGKKGVMNMQIITTKWRLLLKTVENSWTQKQVKKKITCKLSTGKSYKFVPQK